MNKNVKSELSSIYRTKIISSIDELEYYRFNFLKKAAITVILGVPSYIILKLNLLRDVQNILSISNPTTVQIGLVMAILVSIFMGIISYKQLRSYKFLFKSNVVELIIRAIDESFLYKPDDFISKTEFDSSELFRRESINRFHGDDQVSGKIEDVPFKFSEIHAERITGSGKNRRRYTIFHGIYVILNFNKKVKGHTLVYPDVAESMFGQVVGHFLQKRKSDFIKEELVELENPDFEKIYAVYADDQIEARYILTPDIMENLVRFQKRYRYKVYIDFFDRQLHIGVGTGKIFEPAILGKSVQFKTVVEIFELFVLIKTIINSLKLNKNLVEH